METTAPASTAYDPLTADCPTRQVIEQIGQKWTGLVICALGDGPLRFNQLRAAIGGVSQKMLTQTLRQMERDGLVSRTVRPTVPVTVEYALTPLGTSLTDVISSIRVWAFAHMAEIESARERYAAAAG